MRQAGRLKTMILVVWAVLFFAAQPVMGGVPSIDAIMSGMTLEDKIGQMLMPAFRQYEGKAMTEVPPEVLRTIRQHCLGGVILFRENLVTVEQTVRLVNHLQSAAPPGIPLFIAVDQEGGRVTRLPYGTVMPGNMALGAAGDPKNAYLAAKAIGTELKALGINLNFAPSLDVNSNPANPVIGVRSFGENPDTVAAMGREYVKGLSDAAVASAVKHFPGHGDTAVDSHVGLPVVPHGQDRLETVELKPFQEVLAVKPDMVMTAHVTFPAVESGTELSRQDGRPVLIPATLSHKVLTGLLRQRLGFDGVVVTDSLVMQAITRHFGEEQAVVLAVLAGADILLMPSDLARCQAALIRAVETGRIREERINQSVKRILEVKANRGILRPEHVSIEAAQAVVGSPMHRILERQLAEMAVTVVKNEKNTLPFVLRQGSKIAFFAPSPGVLAAMRQELEQIVSSDGLTGVSITGFDYAGTRAVRPDELAAIRTADYIVLATDGVTGGNSTRQDSFAAAVVTAGRQAEKALAVMAVRNPYDIMHLPDVSAYIATYGSDGPNIPAGIRTIFGYARPQGHLPVSIPAADGKGILYPAGHGLSYR